MLALCLILVVLLIVQTNALQVPSKPRVMSSRSMNMMFGAKKAGGAVVIKVDGKTITSSEKSVNLRKELQKNKIDVYPLKAKFTGNCGGAGICGTCAVKVLDGADNFNPPSKNEQKTLKGKPADFRLSCCSKVSGPISIKTKP